MSVALKDANSVASAIFESSTTPGLVLRGQIDQITGRVLVDASGGLGTPVYNEIVSGSGTTFTLAHTPTSGTQAIYGNGQRLTPGAGNDYTISGAVITTANSYSAGQILADYTH